MNERQEKWLYYALAVVLVLALGFIGYKYPLPDEPLARSYNTDVYTEQGGSKLIVASGGEIEVQSGGTLDVQAGASLTSPGGYLLTYATDGYEIVCGATGVFTDATSVAVTSLTAISYAVLTQITDPVATGAYLTLDAPTTTTLFISSWESDFTAGTTGVNAYYCAVGTQ